MNPPVLATPWCWWGWCFQVSVHQRWGSGSAGHTQIFWEPLGQISSTESENDTRQQIFNWTENHCICERYTCAISRESGEHSLSMLLVLSLCALEFCLSFMEVLRGRLCSLFSTLLKRTRTTTCSKYTNAGAGSKANYKSRQKCNKFIGYRTWHNENYLVCLFYRCSDYSDQQRTWETCGFGTPSCRACQRCWLSVLCWRPSCWPRPAPARCRQSLAPGPKKKRRGWWWEGCKGQCRCFSYNAGTVMSHQTTPGFSVGASGTFCILTVFFCVQSELTAELRQGLEGEEEEKYCPGE